MSDPTHPRSYKEPDRTPEELSQELRAKARRAATAVLREGLAELDDNYGQYVADEVAGLIDIAEIFDGLVDDGHDGGNIGDDGLFDPLGGRDQRQ